MDAPEEPIGDAGIARAMRRRALLLLLEAAACSVVVSVLMLFLPR